MSTGRGKRILIVEEDKRTVDRIRRVLEGAGFTTYAAGMGGEALDLIYVEPPDLILIDRHLPDRNGEEILRELKQENIFSHLPVLLLLPEEELAEEIDWNAVQVDDILTRPVRPRELLVRVSLAFSRIGRTLDANPLTRLPGNHSIIREVERNLERGRVFALAYADLDHFKAFNDKYGFTRGDEVLRMTARIITNEVRQLETVHTFVGHVGGDDFVFLIPPAEVDRVCPAILKNFDLIVTTFYDETDRLRRSIETVDRRGKRTTFPIMTLSIAVVSNEGRPLAHFGEFSAVAAEIKKYVKGMPGSNYFKDRRSEQ